MKKLYVAILFLLLGANVCAQTKLAIEKPKETQRVRICMPSRANLIENQPLYVIDNVPMNRQIMGSLSPDNIEEIKVLRAEEALSKYGDKGKNGVLMIFLKKKVKFISLTAILEKIKPKHRKLPIYLGEQRLTDFKDIYFAKANFDKAKVVHKSVNSVEGEDVIQIFLK